MLDIDVGIEATLMAWADINDIIDDLQDVMDDIGSQYPDLHAFKAPIARAIANMRAERASIEATLPGHLDAGSNDSTTDSESTNAALRPLTSTLRSRRLQHVACIANERLKNDLKSLL
jgi:hypothetical protein